MTDASGTLSLDINQDGKSFVYVRLIDAQLRTLAAHVAANTEYYLDEVKWGCSLSSLVQSLLDSCKTVPDGIVYEGAVNNLQGIAADLRRLADELDAACVGNVP